MKCERIVQITDTHIVENYKESVLYWDPINALESVVSDIKSLSHPPQFVIATGDLVHEPSAANYLALKKILSTLDMPVLAIPGNHDSASDMAEFLLGANIEMVECKALAGGGWAVVFLDSQVPGEEHGKISSESISKLQQIYRSLGNRKILLALHHSPTPECFTPSCQLLEKHRLLDFLAEDDKTQAVVSGHTHCLTEKEHAGIMLLTTPSTLFQVDHFQTEPREETDNYMDFHRFDGEKKGYRIIDFFENGTMSSEIRWV